MKKKIRLIWYIYPSYLLIIVLAIFALSLFSTNFLEGFFIERAGKDLVVRGKLLKNQVEEYLNPVNPERLNDICVKAGKVSGTRVTIILTDGKVLGDSKEKPAKMDNHMNRPEVLTALEGSVGISQRNSETLKIAMMYVALPVMVEDKIQVVLRVSIPLTEIENAISIILLKIILGGIIVAVFASIISFYVSRRFSRPIEELKNGADILADGKFDYRLYSPSILELASLSDAMNRMAFQLTERIINEENQKNEYEVVLSSMTEGVIGIDLDDNIISINQAARDILNTGDDEITGRCIQEIARNHLFIEFVKNSVSAESVVEEDFSLGNDGNTIINIRTTSIKNPENYRIGTLIVLTDVTRIRMLENVRRDFVANVSHEIKTPLTAIKGFVETIITLEEGDPDDVKRFLKIVMKHVDRLNAIVDDLLSLARLEQGSFKNEMATARTSLKEIFETVTQVVQARADEKNITIEDKVSEGFYVNADELLLEQAFLNLVDNAVKYSPENTVVSISSEISDNEIVVSIADQGQGISEKHLSRIFERFYRVDRARSRKIGGTGLGLAIVKHIAQAHGGRISVESEHGKGSVFKLHLPL